MTPDFQTIQNLFNAFDPSNPLPPGDPVYVDCQKVRGNQNILTDLANKILLSGNKFIYQIYGGHRGTGKSTELLRLKQDLEAQHNYFVVYFSADEEDINPEDVQYTDILLACTRHLLESLSSTKANPQPLLSWLQDRWEDLQDLALTEVSLDHIQIEISLFTKLTTNLRTEPGQRQKIREKITPHTKTLIEALNKFIEDAQQKLRLSGSQLLLIADSLDRITPIIQADGRTNHDHIFLDRNAQLKALNCHIIYTVPISMLYSSRATDLLDIYGEAQILPMIMVRNPDNSVCQPGLDTFKEIIAKRIYQVAPKLNPEKDVFIDQETLETLCLISGGHVRTLMQLIQDAINNSNFTLPISTETVQIVIEEMREVYRSSINDDQWSILATASNSKRLKNNDSYLNLLFSRCLLEYRYFEQSKLITWCDVHPLIKDIPEFQQAKAQL